MTERCPTCGYPRALPKPFKRPLAHVFDALAGAHAALQVLLVGEPDERMLEDEHPELWREEYFTSAAGRALFWLSLVNKRARDLDEGKTCDGKH